MVALAVAFRVRFITSDLPPDPISVATASRYFSTGCGGTMTIVDSGSIDFSPIFVAFSTCHAESTSLVGSPFVYVLSQGSVAGNRVGDTILCPTFSGVFTIVLSARPLPLIPTVYASLGLFYKFPDFSGATFVQSDIKKDRGLPDRYVWFGVSGCFVWRRGLADVVRTVGRVVVA